MWPFAIRSTWSKYRNIQNIIRIEQKNAFEPRLCAQRKEEKKEWTGPSIVKKKRRILNQVNTLQTIEIVKRFTIELTIKKRTDSNVG